MRAMWLGQIFNAERFVTLWVIDSRQKIDKLFDIGTRDARSSSGEGEKEHECKTHLVAVSFAFRWGKPNGRPAAVHGPPERRLRSVF